MCHLAEKDRFALRLSPEMRERLERLYRADGSRSRRECIENAVGHGSILLVVYCRSRRECIENALNFYIGYLALGEDDVLLPQAVLSAIEGRLGAFEDRISRLLFKQSVELAMLTQLIASDTDADELALRRLRGKCVDDVKRTNGAISFEDALHYQRSV